MIQSIVPAPGGMKEVSDMQCDEIRRSVQSLKANQGWQYLVKLLADFVDKNADIRKIEDKETSALVVELRKRQTAIKLVERIIEFPDKMQKRLDEEKEYRNGQERKRNAGSPS